MPETPDQKRCNPDNPETMWLQPVCERCRSADDWDGMWILWDTSREDAQCELPHCPNPPVAYIRGDLYEAQIAEMIDRLAENTLHFDDQQRPEFALLHEQNKRLRAEHERHIDEIVARAVEDEDELYSRIFMLESENKRVRAQLDRLKAEMDTPRQQRGFGIDWTQCADVESVPGRCSGAWVVKGTRVIVESCIIGNAEHSSAEEIADNFGVPVEIVRRILDFAGVAALDYSDIEPLDDEFFLTAKHPGKP